MAQFTVYKSTDSSAPALSGATGSLVALLDAVLVNGWTASVTSITRSGTTATVTTAGNHGLTTGNSTTISGASQTDYNITAVVTVTSATTFTYTVANSPATPATGTILWKKLAAGWTKSFSGTSKAAYRQASGSNQFYFRVQDDGPGVGTFKEARIVGYEAMTTVDAGTNPFPSVAQATNGLFCRKSTTADGTARAWVIIADDRTIYILCYTGDTANVAHAVAFGDFYSYTNSDGFRTMIIGDNTENSALTNNFGSVGNPTSAANLGHYFARGYVGTGTAVNFGKHGDPVKGSNLAYLTFGLPYPNPADGGFYVSPVWIHDPTTAPANHIRGTFRGLWQCLVSTATLNDLDTFTGTGDLAGKTFLLLKNLVNVSSGGVVNVCIETSATLLTN